MVGNKDQHDYQGDVDALLMQHGISPTQQRRHIARILFARPQHLSAEQILEGVNRESLVASKATVYNTLGLFARKGLVREVIVDPSKIFYDSNTSDHYHFFNTDTGMLEDIEAGQLAISQLPTPPTGTTLDGVDVIIRVKSRA
jgi:Fur family iron response transcriptional regulator